MRHSYIFFSLLFFMISSHAHSDELPYRYSAGELELIVSDFYENLPRKFTDVCFSRSRPQAFHKEKEVIKISEKSEFIFLEKQPSIILLGIYSKDEFAAIEDIQLLSSDGREVALKYIILDVVEVDEKNNLKSEYYSDALSSFEDTENETCSRQGLRVLIDVEQSRLTVGKRSHKLIITMADTMIKHNVEITLLKSKLPYKDYIKTDFFNLSDSSISHFYKSDIGSEDWQEKYDGARSLLAYAGITQSKVFRDFNAKLNTLPSIENLRGVVLQFTDERSIKLYCPNVIESSSIDISFRWRGGAVSLLKNRLGKLKSGYAVNIDREGVLTVVAHTVGGSEKRMQVQLQVEVLNNLVIMKTEKIWSMYLNNRIVDEISLSENLLPATGAMCTIGPGKADVISFSINASSHPHGHIVFVSDLTKSVESIETNLNSLEALTTGPMAGQDVRARYDKDIDTTSNKVDILLAMGRNLEDIYISLPHDEKYSGIKLVKNVEFSNKLKMLHPDVKIIHTFGAMRSAKTLTKSSRLKALEQFRGLVDIWSVRFSLFVEQRHFFQEMINRGAEISLYFHDADSLEHPNSIGNIRSFFHKLNHYGIQRISYWNVNLWFQSASRSRPIRKTSLANSTFRVTKRNPSGIGAGTLLWPGKKNIYPSIRLYAIRAGIFDANLTIAIRNHLHANAGVSNIDSDAVKGLLPGWSRQVQGVELNGNDSNSIRSMRELQANMIEYVGAF